MMNGNDLYNTQKNCNVNVIFAPCMNINLYVKFQDNLIYVYLFVDVML